MILTYFLIDPYQDPFCEADLDPEGRNKLLKSIVTSFKIHSSSCCLHVSFTVVVVYQPLVETGINSSSLKKEIRN